MKSSSCNPISPADSRYEYLIEEARHLHRCMFNREPGDTLMKAYLRAHSEIEELQAVDQHQLKTVYAVVNRGLNPNGIEPWLRGKKVRHLLTAKMLLIAYLAECDARHPEFARNVTGQRMAFFHMACIVLMAAVRLSIGHIQKVRHGLV